MKYSKKWNLNISAIIYLFNVPFWYKLNNDNKWQVKKLNNDKVHVFDTWMEHFTTVLLSIISTLVWNGPKKN